MQKSFDVMKTLIFLKKNHIIISIAAEKALDKSQCSFMFKKLLNKIGTNEYVPKLFNYACIHMM